MDTIPVAQAGSADLAEIRALRGGSPDFSVRVMIMLPDRVSATISRGGPRRPPKGSISLCAGRLNSQKVPLSGLGARDRDRRGLWVTTAFSTPRAATQCHYYGTLSYHDAALDRTRLHSSPQVALSCSEYRGERESGVGGENAACSLDIDIDSMPVCRMFSSGTYLRRTSIRSGRRQPREVCHYRTTCRTLCTRRRCTCGGRQRWPGQRSTFAVDPSGTR